MPTTDDRTLVDHPLLSPAQTGRLIQGSFALIFGGAYATLLALNPVPVITVGLVVPLLLVAAATAVSFTAALSGPAFRAWMVLLPFMDFVAIAALRLDAAGGPTNPLVMTLTLPAIWIGLIGGVPAALSLTAGTLFVITPDVALLVGTLGGDTPDATAQRTLMVALIFPAAMAFAAAIASTLAHTLRARQDALVAEQARRVDAAREIERSRSLMSATLDTLEIGIAIVDPHGEPLLLNRSIRENPLILRAGNGDAWSGFTAVPIFDFDTREPVPDEARALAIVQRGDETSENVVWAGDPERPQRAIAISASAVYAADGEHLAYVVGVTDVTSLVDSLEVKREFLAAVSHELRTPLTMLSGVIELMRDDGLFADDQTRGWISVMERNIERQRRLVDDLLLLASVDRTGLTVRVRDSSLAVLARDAIHAIGPEADRASITLSWQGDDAVGVFDPDRMAQVCDNLITNAVRHGATDSAVTIRTETHDDSLVLTVTDTGRGMTELELGHAFDRFYRSTASSRAAVPGTGLGLPIVKQIADAHGGSVRLTSDPGHGFTAIVTIPRHPADAAHTPS